MTKEAAMTTAFASPERAAQSEINDDYAFIASHDIFIAAIDAVPMIMIVLNNHRQVLYYNKAMADRADGDRMKYLGSRPGEILGCVHADENPAGCGTSESCFTCGAVRAVLEAIGGLPSASDSQITVHDTNGRQSLDFRVTATPIDIDGRGFILAHLVDISDEVRRRILERTFFHDIINTAGNVRYLAEMLRDESNPESHVKLMNFLDIVSIRLIDEIASHRQLLEAERGELVANIQYTQSLVILRDAVDRFEPFAQGSGIDLVIDHAAEDRIIATDTVLLGRVMANLIKNAMEASDLGDTVTVSCRSTEGGISFTVHNGDAMTREVQLQVFNRSFSTKGRDRGIGTYGVRLLTEKYLHGAVGFESTGERGTIFTVTIPLVWA